MYLWQLPCYPYLINFIIAASQGRMRAQSQERGDGSPVGIHVSTAHRRHWFTQERNNGSRVRRRYGKCFYYLITADLFQTENDSRMLTYFSTVSP